MTSNSSTLVHVITRADMENDEAFKELGLAPDDAITHIELHSDGEKMTVLVMNGDVRRTSGQITHEYPSHFGLDASDLDRADDLVLELVKKVLADG